MKSDRDIEKSYSTEKFVEKLRRLADLLENGEKFEIRIAGERIYVPVRAEYTIEHERDGNHEEIEFQIKWTQYVKPNKSNGPRSALLTRMSSG